MKKALFCLLCLVTPVVLFAQTPVENYPEDPASVEHAGVPKGEIIKLTFNRSRIFPGTSRDYFVYVPAQYDPTKPACVWVNQDGIQFKAPTVFDNLINSKEMPVTIGVFVTPGQVKALDDKTALNRYNRSFEYDGLGDAYARFILEEILPEVEQHKTSDGRAIHLSKNAADRGIGGSSSGAIAAFNAAWERPDAFSRVFSSVGTYVGLRGADRFPALIRKYEAKPIRVFLQDGSNDLNIYAGDWFYANQMIERSLKFAGYQVEHTYGEGGHNGKMATAVFPQAMRWLWKDYPQPVTTTPSKNDMLKAILVPGEEWELVGQGYGTISGMGVNSAGVIQFQTVNGAKTYQAELDGEVSAVKNGSKLIAGGNVAVAKNGNKYYSGNGALYLLKPSGKKVRLDDGLRSPSGLALTPDQSQLYVGESATHWIWLYQIKADGALTYKQRYGWLYEPDMADNAGSGGIKCDTSGRVYVATRMGVQVLDQAGRVNAILPIPGGWGSNLYFGGANFDVLYVISGDKIYRRKLKVRGANAFEEPVKPTKPKL